MNHSHANSDATQGDGEPWTDHGELGVPSLIARSSFGGILMGLANLVPGISGGTMLLAAGIYPRFIQSIAELTRFRFRFRSLLTLGCVGAAAGFAILLLAGLLKDLVVDHRWIMYSLFIGLTLGGVPLVWKLARPANTALVIAAVAAFLAMVLLALLQASESVSSTGSGFFSLALAGLAGASAMILPGLSGGYLLLLLGQYVPILGAVEKVLDGLKARDFGAIAEPFFDTLLPVAIGVVVGIVVVGNLLQWLLSRYRKATLGLLLGLLLGSVAGLYPFKQAVEPTPGDTIKGQVVTAETISEIESDDWPNELFTPTIWQVLTSLALVGVGFGITLAVASIGGGESSTEVPDNR